MLNDNAKAWVAALRSGDYKQGQGKLRSHDTFCCLGVACDLAVKAGLPIAVGSVTDDPHFGDYTFYDGRGAHLPPAVMDWLGLSDPWGDVTTKSLTRLNDSYNLSFEQIANIIESEPEGLFA